MSGWAVFSALAVAVLVAAERETSRPGAATVRAIAKLAASTGFLGVAWTAGATHTPWGLAILVALVLSWLGDAFLLSEDRRAFLAGLGSFLLAHLAYVAAFLLAGVSVPRTLGALVPLVLIAAVVWRWLRPHLDTGMAAPVAAYVLAITAMAILAFGCHGDGALAGRILVPVGAVAFFLSDLSVARDRFVRPGWINRLWGLPLYYLGQMLLAMSSGVGSPPL